MFKKKQDHVNPKKELNNIEFQEYNIFPSSWRKYSKTKIRHYVAITGQDVAEDQGQPII